MAGFVAANPSTSEAKSSDVVQSTSGWFVRWTEVAVNFVLKRVGIKVELDDSTCRDEITKQMMVVAACGRRVGYVDEIVGDFIKLVPAQSDLQFIPLHWVDRVDSRVLLERDFEEVSRKI